MRWRRPPDVASEYDWLKSIPVPAGPPDLRMGTRALDVAGWLAADALVDDELALRAELLAAHRDFVHIDPGHGAALDELRSLVEIHIGNRLRRDLDDPIEQLALSVQEDVLLMDRVPDETDGGSWRLIGGTLLFANQWRLQDKLGQDITTIHGPVDGYDPLLAARVTQFFDRLSPARPVWRRNWFFHDDPTFFQPERMIQAPIRASDGVPGLWIRSEYQTLRRLAFSEVIVFTVKTQVAPMTELVGHPELARQMITFLESASPRSLKNKDADGRHRAIIDYLTHAELG